MARVSERVSGALLPTVLVIAALSTLGWLAVDASRAPGAALAVLLVASPLAAAAAMPAAVFAGMARAASLGITFADLTALEVAGRVNTALIDKAGIITNGTIAVTDVISLSDEVSRADVLRLAAAVESPCEHPIARAIIARAHAEVPEPTASAAGVGDDGVVIGSSQVLGFAHSLGGGVAGQVRTAHSGPHVSRRVVVGRLDWVMGELGHPELNPELSERLLDAVDEAGSESASVVVVAWNGYPQAIIVLADAIRRSAVRAIEGFIALGVRPYLLTGDGDGVAREVAHDAGISSRDVFPGMHPGERTDVVRTMLQSGACPAMIRSAQTGAAALDTDDWRGLAHGSGHGLGMMLGVGTAAGPARAQGPAREVPAGDVVVAVTTTLTGDVVVADNDLRRAASALALGQRIPRTGTQNLTWALAFHMVAVPAAAFGLLHPVLAAGLMVAATSLIALNALRLRHVA